jgi:lipopolysaccharide export system protein LptA
MHIHSKYYITLTLTCLLLIGCLAHRSQAQPLKPQSHEQISVDASDSEIAPGYVLYHSAVVTMKSGNKLRADEIKVFGANNKFEKATATGHVRADVIDAQTNGKYIVTADNGLYDPATNTLDLAGNVKLVATNQQANDPNGQPGKSYTTTGTSDRAVYDMTAETINLAGNVKMVVENSSTEGPIVQTGTAATVTLGKGPDFPKIDMQQVHTEFTLKQQ